MNAKERERKKKADAHRSRHTACSSQGETENEDKFYIETKRNEKRKPEDGKRERERELKKLCFKANVSSEYIGISAGKYRSTKQTIETFPSINFVGKTKRRPERKISFGDNLIQLANWNE